MSDSRRFRNGKRWRGNEVRPWVRLAIYIRDGFTCVYCKRDLRNAPAFEVTLDHTDPRSQGGAIDDPATLVTACRACNCSRKDKPLRVFADANARRRVRARVSRPLNRSLALSILRQRKAQRLAA